VLGKINDLSFFLSFFLKFQEKITNSLASSFIDGQPHLALIPQIGRETKTVRYKEVEAGKKGNSMNSREISKFPRLLTQVVPSPPPSMVSENEG
jgi:hypothetical protein